MRNALRKWYDMRIILIDDRNRKWGASEYGIHLFDPLSEQFRNYQFPAQDFRFYINSRLMDAGDGRILIVYENAEGAFVFDLKTETFQTLLPSTDIYLTDSIFNAAGLVQRPGGEIWLLERRKVYRVSFDTGSLIPVDLPIDDLPHFWTSVVQDHNGAFWLGSGISGLVYYHPESGEIRTYKEQLETGEMPTSAWITYLFLDHYGNLWIRKEWGYAVLLHETDTILNFNTYQGQKHRVGNFLEDDDGNVWTSYPGGLLKMSSTHPELGVLESVGTAEGLINLAPHSLTLDGKGHLWMMTRNGLQQYSPDERVSRLFDDKDGMILYDERFNRNPARLCYITLLSDGRLAYAPRAGFSIFHPDSLSGNTEIPVPYIRQVSAADTLITTDLFKSSESIIFPYRQNDIEIECSSIAYSQSANIRYQYHLGNDEWKDMNDRRILFSSLAPGDYRFYLRAVNSSGLPSDELRYAFRIKQPWWRAWWFMALSIVCFGAGIWYIVRRRERHLRNIQQKEREVQVLMASLESRALRNQMNPHFLFNIFNTIQELILTGDTERAYTYTTKFSKLLRMILDHARKDEITIEQERIFLQLYLELEALRFDDVFTYTVDVEEGLELMHIPVFVVQPLAENAIRHGLLPASGERRLQISFSAADDAVLCRVCDNGVGLDSQEIQKRAEDRDHALQLIRQRLRHIDGATLTLTNNQGAPGVEALLVIPMKS
jgi:streptogramin lyase